LIDGYVTTDATPPPAEIAEWASRAPQDQSRGAARGINRNNGETVSWTNGTHGRDYLRAHLTFPGDLCRSVRSMELSSEWR